MIISGLPNLNLPLFIQNACALPLWTWKNLANHVRLVDVPALIFRLSLKLAPTPCACVCFCPINTPKIQCAFYNDQIARIENEQLPFFIPHLTGK